jgi:hypothetical protein
MDAYKAYKMGNKKIRAALTKPNENTLTMMPVRSLVYVPSKYKKHFNRMLMTASGRPLLLLADHHPSHEHDVYLGLSVNTQIELTEQVVTIHPVTRLATSEVKEGVRTISGVFELGSIKDELSLIIEKNIYYLAEPVSKHDKLDGKTIKKVQQLAGLYRVEVD